jgi:hypothetical protein
MFLQAPILGNGNNSFLREKRQEWNAKQQLKLQFTLAPQRRGEGGWTRNSKRCTTEKQQTM